MAFSIPNEADASVAAQAAPDSKDIEILVAGYAGTGVVSGAAVTAQGSPDMTLAVAAGVVAVLGVQATVTAGNVTITTAHATNPRFDLVVSNASGTKSVTAGTAAATPVFPTIPASSVVLAAIYVPANDTAIGSTQIVDKRVVLATAQLVVPDAAWIVVGSGGSAPAFENSWSSFGSGYPPPRFRKMPDGRVQLSGLATHTGNSTATAFTLPVGYRPDYPVNFYGSEAALTGVVETDGRVRNTGTGSLLGLTPHSFFP